MTARLRHSHAPAGTAPAPGSDLLFLVNAVFGGRNTPGFRPYQPIRFGLLAPTVIARGAALAYQPIQFPLPGRSLIPRALNAVRIKLWPALPARALEQALFDRLCLRASRRLGWRPRAVHLWDPLPLTAAYWHSQGVPLVVDLPMAHPRCYQPLLAAGAIDPATLGPLEDPALERCLALAERVICPSPFVRQTLPQAVQAKCRVIPFGADAVTAPPAPRPAGAPLRVLFAGNVNQRKGVAFLIEAWRRLPPALRAGAELVLCGRVFKEMAGVLDAAEAEFGAGSIRVAGFQGEMAPWFAGADLFVLPSLMEGSAKAVYEAMAHGLPVLVSSHTGAVVTPGVDGLVVPPADAAALAEALAHLLGDAALRQRLGTAARQTAAGYTWERYAAAVAAVHEDWPDPVPGVAPLADTWAAHQSPQPLATRAARAAERGLVRLKAGGRRIGGTNGGGWLRFPFYHHVFADERRGFARHLQAMRDQGEWLGLEQAVTLLERGEPIDGRYFCLSFDDGLRNLLTHAAPILDQHQAPAAVFVISDLTPERAGASAGDPAAFFGPRRRPAAFLSWDDCRTLAAAGWTIGAHSASHRRLSQLDQAAVIDELARSKAAIEAALGTPCPHFAAPWGKPERDFHPERDPALAASLGYRSFLTTSRGPMTTGSSPFLIRRTGLVAYYGLAQLRYFLSL